MYVMINDCSGFSLVINFVGVMISHIGVFNSIKKEVGLATPKGVG